MIYLAFQRHRRARGKTKIIVLFKKGDAQLAANYRPVAILSILYKVFSRMLCSRIAPFVMAGQTVEQASYRKGFSTEDHLLAVTLLLEKSSEHNMPVWLALVDFEKAFDTVEHVPLWRVLREQGVPQEYTSLLQFIYRDQEAFVQAGAKSRSFSVGRGVKQGDPTSALLFVAVMQSLFGKLQKRWHAANSRRRGIKFGVDFDGSCRNLLELRFADDVVLFAQQESDIVKMLRDLSEAAAPYGLKINFSKTKILTRSKWSKSKTSVQIGDQPVSILDEHAAEKYLGRKLSLENMHEVELQNRLAAGWAAFHKYKGELCSPAYRIKDRVKLFKSVVDAVVLYGSSAWALTAGMERHLRTTWRKMLRYVFRIHRRKDASENGTGETWVDFVKRSAHTVDSMADFHGLENWAMAYRRRKWRFAGRLARQTDDRWSAKLLEWQPCHGMGRSRGHPKTRWADQIEALAGGNWREFANDVSHWGALEEGFVQKAFCD